ncbi:MAG: translocation/assembly module TamB domain-containing protein, partial [Myxococcales bacterium]|nr:translocation/assembly module TamB domain-containing protein [Myxococcales bacterium]
PDDVTSDVSTPICAPTPTSKAQDGGSVATLDGDLALGAFAGIARAYGLGKISGRVGVHDVALRGHLSAPVITGQIDIPADNPPIEVTLGGDTKLKLEIPALLLKIVDDTLYISGDAKLGGQKFWFGDLGNHQTFFMLGGDSCAGTFGVAARGELDGRLLQANLPKVFLRATGSFEIKDFFLEGQVKDEPRIDTLFGLIEPGPRGFLGELTFGGLDPIQISRGPIEVVRCSSRQRCPDDLQGYAAFIGGRAAARAGSAPTTALRAKIGTRGRATVWGYAVVNSDFSGLAASDLRLEFADVRFTSFDNSGRPQLKTVLSSDGVALQGREFMRLAGDIQVVSAKWIRDAQEQFKVLSFEDPTPAPESAPPPFLEQLQLDLNVRTSSPARVDNNVFKGVEGHLQLTVGGTYGDLDLAGKIDVNTGVLDINILGTPYDIQRGKVVLQEELSESTVDVLAVRQEPIYIDNQPRQMYLELGGTLDTIEWRCIVQGDATGALSSYECAQYLVLGGGEQEAAESTVKRYGGGGLLGKPINLFGNLTKVRLNRYIEDSAPGAAPYIPEVSLQLGQFGIVADVETPPRWFRSNWANLRLGAGYTRGYPGLLLRQSANWRVRFKLLDNLSLEFRDSSRSYYNERIIFDPLRQQKLELKFDLQLPSVR